ncbi:alanine:cation symporter family protein [Anaerotignum lactatifermentans]|uniref:Alanine:cation symporter family protein n=2 Tax=Anaerotignum lactatifermentans TaxID=160404 RepID=A0ABS2G8J2_9FIRM|nr:alanine/glycine:cation symporter family protein [Anaerotignum lactatifermentans]MBM6829441.1 alanine:cation symporter family protein [Anaerotignum lactatifermentans]MBM6877799.1 alanine:cation symporter family protein [Anaerotignum lactatifermentans]MBM6951018.1 alanine:cation symporter family protein [Anaerotignum lactatifermentans]
MDIISSIQGVVWGPVMLVLLFGTHVFLTIRTKVIQRYVFKGIKLSITPDKEAEGDVSGFGALATALAATIGTGNIVGVATAIASGGPGAVFWVWLTGLFGIASKYGEAVLAIKYRVKGSDGAMNGGPMYALERGLKQKWLGILFALFAGFACFGIGNGTQGNSITGMVQANFGISPYITGIVLTIGTGAVILGGVKSIAKVCEKLVPFMAGFYIIGCIVILILNRSYLGEAFTTIIKSAFTGNAMGGGFIGATVMMAIRFGIARGLFTNESGLGSAPIADAAAMTRNPVRQGLIAMTGVFWDTIIVCALTGLVLVSSILRNPGELGGLTGGDLSSAAFATIPVIGPAVLTIGLITFAWSTILGWSYYGERCWVYLVGEKAIMPFRVAWTIVVFIGSVVSLDLVWGIADILNALMAFPNLVALLGLSGVIAAETKKYLFDDNMDAWSDDEVPLVDRH